MNDFHYYNRNQGKKNILLRLDEEISPCNLLVSGARGAGRSTLLQTVFGAELIREGVGTRGNVNNVWMLLKSGGLPLRIYDTAGIELNRARYIKDTIMKDLDYAKRERTDERIHNIWYCVDSNRDGIDDIEADFITWLYKLLKLPVFIVLTKAVSDEKCDTLRQYIEDALPNVDRLCFFPVLACAQAVSQDGKEDVIPPFGLAELAAAAVRQAPEDKKRILAAAQQVNPYEKRAEAQKILENLRRYNLFGSTLGIVPFLYSDEIVSTIKILERKILVLYAIDGELVASYDMFAAACKNCLTRYKPAFLMANKVSGFFYTVGCHIINAAEAAFGEITRDNTENKYDKAKIFQEHLRNGLVGIKQFW